MIVLAVTTSTWRGGVAVVASVDDSGGTRCVPLVMGSVEYEAADDHAERLFPTIEAAMRQAGVEKRDIGLIACDIGPGSFTGIRAATSAMAAIAWTLHVPTVPIGSLHAMAWAASQHAQGRAVLSILDARRQELYFAIHGENGPLLGPSHLPVTAVAVVEAARVEHGALVVGEFAAALPGFDPLRGPELDLPSATTIGLMALAGAVARGPLDPVYVRAPDAKTTEELAALRAR